MLRTSCGLNGQSPVALNPDCKLLDTFSLTASHNPFRSVGKYFFGMDEELRHLSRI